jgi:enoyl-CoA hydratase/carnithine racemase
LPELVGPQRAFDLLVSGRSITGAQAAAMGIAYEAVADPEHAAPAYFEEHLSQKARVHYTTQSKRRGSTTSRASKTRSAPLSGFISTSSWPPTTRWLVLKLLSRRGRHNGNIVEPFGYGRHRRTRERAVRGSFVHFRARMESREARP